MEPAPKPCPQPAARLACQALTWPSSSVPEYLQEYQKGAEASAAVARLSCKKILCSANLPEGVPVHILSVRANSDFTLALSASKRTRLELFEAAAEASKVASVLVQGHPIACRLQPKSRGSHPEPKFCQRLWPFWPRVQMHQQNETGLMPAQAASVQVK